jgi:hypothetical protein
MRSSFFPRGSALLLLLHDHVVRLEYGGGDVAERQLHRVG